MKVHWLQIHKQVKSGSIVWFSVFNAWQTAKVSTPSHQFTVHHLTSLQEVHNICLLDRGAVKGGKVRTILRAHDGRGPPEGETWFLPRGTLEPCISARPRPGFDRANFHVIIQTFRLLDIHQLVMKKIAALVETTGDHAALTESGSTVFSVQQQQRAVSADEEFCVQIHAIKLAIKPQQK